MEIRRMLSGVKRKTTDFLAGPARGFGRSDGRDFTPVEMGGITVGCQQRWPDDSQLLRQWDQLSLSLPDATPFHSPGWIKAAYEVGSNGRPLRILTAHRAGQLVAVVPLEFPGDGSLVSIGAPMSDYTDPLVSQEQPADIWGAILSFAAQNFDRKTSELCFFNVRESCLIRAILPKIAGFSYEENFQENAPFVALPDKWDDFIEHLEAHERRETRRKLRKAEAEAGAKLVSYTGADIPAALERGIAILESCGGDKGAAITRSIRPLLLKAGPALIEAGRFHVKLLTVDGVQAGVLLEFTGPTGPMLYNTGFDTIKKEWSPGTVAVAMTLRDCVQRGIKAYDFLRGQEPYKYRLGAVDRKLYRVVVKKTPARLG